MKQNNLNRNWLLASLCGLILSFQTLATDEYWLPEQRLDSKAGRSTELYVAPDFNFATHRTITLDLLALDGQGDPLTNSLIVVSGRTVQEKQLNHGFSLLGMVKTDDTGMVYREMEIGSNIAEIELIIKVVGIENRITLDLADSLFVKHIFE